MTFVVGCGPAFNPELLMLLPKPEQAHADPRPESSPGGGGSGDKAQQPPPTPQPGSFQQIKIDQVLALRKGVANVLELVAEAPAGTVLGVPSGYQVKHLDYREKDGSIERSSTGFVTPIFVVSVPASANWSQGKIDEINRTAGGLFVSARIVGSIEGVSGNFAAIAKTTPDADYLKQYGATGKPKFTFTAAVLKRFGPRLNKGIPADQMNTSDRERYQRIYEELKLVANRKVATPKSLLLIDNALAIKLSEEYDKTRSIAMNGAWSIAVNGTAVRHGFENVPCAEFMSEVIRQAYQRAGYRVTDDFSTSRGNELYWTKTAAVVNLSKSLYDAGWIPWDTTKYRPPVGALMFHRSGISPGHTYIAAGDDGAIIVDNGSPQGRDLRKSTLKVIELMYMTGLFFLPPGIQPDPW